MYNNFDYISPQEIKDEHKFLIEKNTFNLKRLSQDVALEFNDYLYQLAEENIRQKRINIKVKSSEDYLKESQKYLDKLQGEKRGLNTYVEIEKRTFYPLQIPLIIFFVIFIYLPYYQWLPKLSIFLHTMVILFITSVIISLGYTGLDFARRIEITRRNSYTRSKIKKARREFFIFSLIWTITLTVVTSIPIISQVIPTGKLSQIETIFLPLCTFLISIIWFFVCYHLATKDDYRKKYYKFDGDPASALDQINSNIKRATLDYNNFKKEIQELRKLLAEIHKKQDKIQTKLSQIIS
jgi:hypothetical protein